DVPILPRQPTVAFIGLQRSKKPLFTLTGFFFASNEMLSAVPPLNALDRRKATNPSLNCVHTNSGHSPLKKSKSKDRPFALFGTLISRWIAETSWTSVETTQPVAAFG